ncbi:MAG: Nif3-like dinuclear metal center hexameric protein [Bacteroidaceae bacterium]|jgi:dinuclear metal center YbgI/SA1388 family protein|nr:Nif3-like dinuclear metal center hexameric protein [Bacteroidaceae bacterium]
MKAKQILDALEQYAPLPLQDSFDNAGLQIGLTEEQEVTGALLCLDVTEDVIDEAVRKGCNLIVAHHPLLFHGLKSITGKTYVERCVVKAIKNGVGIYAAHTNLDNAQGGVNYRIAEKIGLDNIAFLETKQSLMPSGAGVIGVLPEAEDEEPFLNRLKTLFDIKCLRHNALCGRKIRKVALCGGAGGFLLDNAIKQGADAFLTGEMRYHDYFGHDGDLLIAEMGHYESEQYTMDIFEDMLRRHFPELKIEKTSLNTNPIYYL